MANNYNVKDIVLADFGRKELVIAEGGVSWECTDLVDALKAAV